MKASKITVEVAYALASEQVIVSIKAPNGITAKQAIQASGILNKYPEIDLAVNKIGIFGKPAKLDALLKDLDRVEIYRPLIADPKEARKQRAAHEKVVKKGGEDSPPRI